MFSVLLLFALVLPPSIVLSDSLPSTVGDEVCAEGIAMDDFCIQRGTLFDIPTIVTLEGPEQHSVKCLMDVPDCVAGAYEILLPPEIDGTNWTRGYRLDNETKAGLFAVAMEYGVCGNCEGSGIIEKGLTVVVQGEVVAAADGETPPTISGTVTLANPSSPVCTAGRFSLDLSLSYGSACDLVLCHCYVLFRALSAGTGI
jgi:hypothetical protein